MKTVKYLFLCLMNTLSANLFYTKDFIIGCIQIVAFFAVFLISTVLLTWYYGLLIMSGVMLALYGIVCIIELFIRLIKR